ncbi:GIY-YIG catalytic domain-containing protein [Roseovarius tolerans]|uniref:GIY-YIG catalytic domain-containing protein n=1 Tax=Roseovarius tolerans TaxID=74031 RepID=A0A1H8DFN8_9RHOB|nr:GIY-YIG nuclease family protein [Roseovarius tolerans]SEN05945.1 GIY-YIG catalytic domain-containing protein [Roseovarius tolerans]
MTLRDDILTLIQERPGITDAEIAGMIPGPKSRHQQVNARCRKLAEDGLIQRVKPSFGAIANHPKTSKYVPEGSPRPRAGEKPPPWGAVGGCPAVPPGVATLAVAPTRLSVEFYWQSVGEITLQASALRFPRLPECAGIYRIRLPISRSVYVGETLNLRRRMQNYRTPGASQKTSIWVNSLLLERLDKNEPVMLETCTEAVMRFEANSQDAELTSKTVRVMIEHAAILSERHTNWNPLNKAN